MSDILAKVKVLEFSTVTKSGGMNTRPMSGTWLPERQRIVLTTPAAYPQKALNVRRDGRVAVLYSDFTGSGLPPARAVLVQGIADAPDVVAAPQDLPDYWRGLFRKNPNLAAEVADPQHRATMDWYYWRLPILVEPQRIDVLQPTAAGGAWEPTVPDGTPMWVQLTDALTRYPSAVFTAQDEEGYPYSARAYVSQPNTAPSLHVHTEQPFRGVRGPANLLWHRHDGHSGEMAALLVAGIATGEGQDWTFTPERMPGLLPSGRHEPASFEEWIEDGRRRSAAYMEKSGIAAPTIDWAELASFGHQ
uniref:pyridoxamine 5'-phosphate oxidase family protein n=1 Tax=Nocardia donostiensis TaxID=1538463 RepID=UPI001C3914C4|nr:pyridoxamine 5'-phosphate oxidase family protein [Nocardia donostiensis]